MKKSIPRHYENKKRKGNILSSSIHPDYKGK